MYLRQYAFGLGTCILFAVSSLPSYGQASLVGLGDLPGGRVDSEAWAISLDGNAVVGTSISAEIEGDFFGREAFRWKKEGGLIGLGGLPGIPETQALAVSEDGKVVVGWARLGNGPSKAFRWTEENGMISLGTLLPGDEGHSVAFGVSADGTVVVGSSSALPNLTKAFRWTESEGMIGLPDPPGGSSKSLASDISHDGKTIVGYSDSPSRSSRLAFRWTETDGTVLLGFLREGGSSTNATAISADGSTIVGRASNANGLYEPFLWTENDGMVSLGFFPTETASLQVWDVSGDGSVVVGYVALAGSFITRPFIWDVQHGMRDFQEAFVNNYGPDIAEDWLLDEVRSVSEDGRSFTGPGFNLVKNAPEAWIATFPAPADIDGDSDVDASDFSFFAACFNKAGNPPRGGCSSLQSAAFDFDNDRDIDGADFAVFAACFNKAGNPPRTAGCPQW